MKNLFFLAAFFTAALVFGGSELKEEKKANEMQSGELETVGYTCCRVAYDFTGFPHSACSFSTISDADACEKAWYDAIQEAEEANNKIMPLILRFRSMR